MVIQGQKLHVLKRSVVFYKLFISSLCIKGIFKLSVVLRGLPTTAFSSGVCFSRCILMILVCKWGL